MTYVWHSSWHYFGYISVKVVKQHFLESPLWSLKTRQHSYQQGYPLRNNGPLKIWKICVFLAAPFSKEICWYLEFFGHRLIIFKKLRYRGQLFWNYEPSKLLLHFTEYRLDQLNSNHTIFWRLLSKEMSAKSLSFFGPPITKWRPCKVFAKLNRKHLLMANVFKFRGYQTFGLMKMHNMC